MLTEARAAEFGRARPLLRGERGVAACGHPLAASAAARLLADGGTAVDAAVAAAAVLFVVLPDACGLGGDALAIVRTPDGGQLAFNGSGAAPAGLGEIPGDGAGAAAVPGAVAALAELHQRYGRLSWGAAWEPAVRISARGMPLTEDLAATIARHRVRLELSAPAWRGLDPALTPGTRIAQPELAGVIARIAEEGPAALYEGSVADAVEAACVELGGYLTAADLKAHRTPILPPVTRERLGAQVSAQPPVSQALLLLIALGALEAATPAPGPDRVHHLVEALEGAFALRDQIARPHEPQALADAPVAIDPERARRLARAQPGAHTTSVATADADGVVVSMLVSVFSEFGSSALVPAGGFLLNNRLHGFGAAPNLAAPGRRPVHTLSPSMVSHGELTYALCTPGADGQVQTLSQVLTKVLLEGASLPEALAAPRWRSAGGGLVAEADYDPDVLAGLEARGHEVIRRCPGQGFFGAAACAGIDLAAGTTFATTDPRREVWGVAV